MFNNLKKRLVRECTIDYTSVHNKPNGRYSRVCVSSVQRWVLELWLLNHSVDLAPMILIWTPSHLSAVFFSSQVYPSSALSLNSNTFVATPGYLVLVKRKFEKKLKRQVF